jgi:serine/threonine protein kinase
MPLAKGDRLGDFILAGPPVMGDFGEIWKADPAGDSGESVYLHVISDPQAIEALSSEDLAPDRRAFPHVLPLVASDLAGDPAWLAYKYVVNKPLNKALAERRKLSLIDSTLVIQPVLEALAAGHAAGQIHMDLRPANVLLCPGQVVYLTDFALGRTAAALNEAARTSPRRPAPFGDADVRRLSEALRYLAPEQIAGEPPTPRCDVYSAGMMLHEMLTGETRRLRFPINGVPSHLSDAVERATRPDPAERFTNAAQFLAAVEPPAAAAAGGDDDLYKLYLLDDEHPPKPLKKDVILFGSRPGLNIRLLDPQISDMHAVLSKTSVGWVLTDLQSDSGTLLNGAPVKAAVVKDGDVIQLGARRFRFGK